MSAEEPQGEDRNDLGGLPDGLRSAVEKTIAATADTAAETAERAQVLLDEVAKRGQRTREGLSRVRFASSDEVKELNARLAGIEERLARIEIALRTASTQSNPKAES